jgi:hypothetical protein
VSNWIDCGGDAPPLCTDDNWENSDRRHARRLKAPLTIGIAVLLWTLGAHLGHAHDPSHPELKAWFESLRSGGAVLLRRRRHCGQRPRLAIRQWALVRLDGEWIDVPDEAVITEPNRVGRTMVWPLLGYMGTTIRCFMPGGVT